MRTFSRWNTLTLGFGLVILSAVASSSARAEAWPQRTVRLIVPLPVGTGVDVAARLLAQGLAERWGKAVIVENRQGADGILAATTFLAAHDRHTLMFSFAGLITINPFIHDQLPYDPARDLVPIVSVEDNFFAIAVTDKLKVATLDELVQLARTQPGKLNWAATPGLPMFIFEALQKQASIQLSHVSYGDFGPALRDLDEGRIDVAVTALPLLLPHVQAGKARLLVVSNPERTRLAPEIPTAREAGYPDLTFDGVVGLYGWRDMPAGLKEKIADDVHAVIADRVIVERIEGMGAVVRVDTPAEFAAAIEAQRAKIATIARNLTPTP